MELYIGAGRETPMVMLRGILSHLSAILIAPVSKVSLAKSGANAD